jgi:hypothetical protein
LEQIALMPERITSETQEAIAAGMPPCPLCGGHNVRPSVVMRLEDRLRAIFHYAPFRCRTCQHRFHHRVKAAPPALKADQAKVG